MKDLHKHIERVDMRLTLMDEQVSDAENEICNHSYDELKARSNDHKSLGADNRKCGLSCSELKALRKDHKSLSEDTCLVMGRIRRLLGPTNRTQIIHEAMKELLKELERVDERLFILKAFVSGEDVTMVLT